MDTQKPKIVVICGPTATGKTKLSVDMAQKYNGEIISADSMQIYQKLNVGTAKATKEEMMGIKHYLVDFLLPDVSFSVVDFVNLAQQAINEICLNNKLPIVAGGTGLYISSLVNGIAFTGEKPNQNIRDDLAKQANELGNEAMLQRLADIDPEYAQKQNPANIKRILRALELYMQTGVTMTQQLADSKPKTLPYDALIIGITFANRQLLYQKIEQRIDNMLNGGLLNEARFVYDNKKTFITAAQAIGYKEFFPYFENTKNLEECVLLLKQSSRRYAKRQLTWFKRIPNIKWLLIDETKDLAHDVGCLIDTFLNN